MEQGDGGRGEDKTLLLKNYDFTYKILSIEIIYWLSPICYKISY